MTKSIELSLEKQILMNRISKLLEEKDALENKLNICIYSYQLLKKHPENYFEIQRTLKKLDKIINL